MAFSVDCEGERNKLFYQNYLLNTEHNLGLHQHGELCILAGWLALLTETKGTAAV